MGVSNAFDQVMQGVAGVIHTASDMSMSPDPHKVITPVTNGVRNVLSAAAAHPNIKRFVYTSSATALAQPDPDKKRRLDVNTWNDAAVEEAWAEPFSHEKYYLVYSASKCAAQLEAWKFIADNKPGFTLNTVNLDYNIGPFLYPSQPGSTNALTKGLFAANPDLINMFKTSFEPRVVLNVQDTAWLHVAALLFPDVENERVLASVEPVGYDELVESFKRVDPKWDRLKPDVPWRDLSTIDTSRGRELLRRMGGEDWIGLDASVKQCVLGQ